jgi:hypothetical protein
VEILGSGLCSQSEKKLLKKKSSNGVGKAEKTVTDASKREATKPRSCLVNGSNLRKNGLKNVSVGGL